MLKTRSLVPATRAIVCDKATEHPFSESPHPSHANGSWLCRQCGLALFRAKARFEAGCGWPAFNSEIPGTVREQRDADGFRDEILCARCGGHLGHVFRGEGFTSENLRHCVNSASLDFVDNAEVMDSEEAIFAAGCFWGVEYLFRQLPGVLKTEVGYTGGHKDQPTYNEVCRGNTGHYEAIRVLFDPKKIIYESVVKYFYEIHHPEQPDGQGPDRGTQYLSAIFVHDESQKIIAEKITGILRQQGLHVATKILPTSPFWPAEEYHQDYYAKTGKKPYCHIHVARF